MDSPLGVRPVSLAAPRMVVPVGEVGVAVESRQLRRAADAARIEQVLAAAVVHRVAVDVEAEQPGALDEERAPLLEERLEGAEVEHRGIGLDLAEVRIDRAVQREVGRDAVLEVGPAGEALVAVEPPSPVGTGDVLGRRRTATTSSRRGDASPVDARRSRRAATRVPPALRWYSGQLTRSL